MPSAAELLAARIAADGPVRFDAYLDLALYGEGGFYTAHGSAGRRRGDFITSPEIGPLFGAVVARWIAAEHRRQGEPEGFAVIEAGAGRGALARSVLAAAPAQLPALSERRVRYVAVELSEGQRAQHPASIESSALLPTEPVPGVVIANELLDNLPFRLLVFDGGWREAHVDLDRHGRTVEVLAPLDEPLPDVFPTRAPHGARVPWQQRATAWIDQARALVPGGTVLAFDYTTATTGELSILPWRAWLRTYRSHERGKHYLADVGEQDITAQVVVDQLPDHVIVRSQVQWLERWGIAELVEEGRQAWAAAAAAPTVAAMTMRSRISEADALLDPAGLGGFTALEWPGTST